MKNYEIINLETGKTLQTVDADGFVTDEHGIVIFYEDGDRFSNVSRTKTAITQISSSVLIAEKKSPKPALVVPITEGK